MIAANTHVRLDLTKLYRELLTGNPVGLHRNHLPISLWCILSHRVPALCAVSLRSYTLNKGDNIL